MIFLNKGAMEYWSAGVMFFQNNTPLLQHSYAKLFNNDGLAKSREILFSVIPAKAGIQ
jgi:hypothetical protein